MLLTRFSRYNKKDRERAKKNLIYIFESFEKKSGLNGYWQIGEGTEVVSSNIHLEMFNFMLHVMEDYYPYGLKLSIGIGLPQFYFKFLPEIFSYMKGPIKDVITFKNYTDLPQFIDEEYIPSHLLEKINNKSV